MLAWSEEPPDSILPSDPAVKYVGETSYFKGRMDGFRTSAGFCGKRDDGHSAGWRWPEGRSDCLWVAFFRVENSQPHLEPPDPEGSPVFKSDVPGYAR